MRKLFRKKTMGKAMVEAGVELEGISKALESMSDQMKDLQITSESMLGLSFKTVHFAEKSFYMIRDIRFFIDRYLKLKDEFNALIEEAKQNK